MRLHKLIILLSLPLSIISCGNSTTISYEEKINIIDNLIDNVYIKAHAKQNLIYEEGFESYNSSDEYHFERQYSSILENNKYINAVRFSNNGNISTYFEGETGKAYYQVFDTDYNIKNIDLVQANAPVNYSKIFLNPFSFIDTTDIKDDLSLDLAKANFIIRNLLNLQVSATKAKFVYENNIAVALDLTLADKDIMLELYTKEQIHSTLKTEISIKFNYDVAKIDFLKKKDNKDEIIINALNKLKTNNYTIDVYSDNLEDNSTLYVTEDTIYLHKDKEYLGMSNGDILYTKNGNYFNKYVYIASNNSFNLTSSGYKLNSIIPSFNKINENLFTKSSIGQYVLNYQEAKLNAELLLIPNFNFFPGQNQKALISVVNNEIRNISVMAESSSIVVINETIYNQGNTTIPSWVNLSLIA